jgi:pimeloyl-ACP methyl ester carboxylesterase
MIFSSDGTDIYYSVRGSGRPLVLLHPFPANHRFWDECAPFLENRYQLILPDLRAHGDSAPGAGPATMSKHAQDLARLCDTLEIGKAIFAGVSIGGYVLFEFWRQFRERMAALVLANTRAGADSDVARLSREKSIAEVEQRGPAPFIEDMLVKLLGETTRRSRLDRLDAARAMMSRMTVKGIVAALQGLASRPDSTQTLATINVPTLLLAGEEDTLTPNAEAQLMHKGIRGSRLEIIPKAGHYAAFEQPESAGRLLRTFADSLP